MAHLKIFLHLLCLVALENEDTIHIQIFVSYGPQLLSERIFPFWGKM